MLKKGVKSKEQHDLFWALIQDYNAIYYVDLDADKFSVQIGRASCRERV